VDADGLIRIGRTAGRTRLPMTYALDRTKAFDPLLRCDHIRTRHHTGSMLETAFVIVPILAVAGLLIIWSQLRRHR
jgi:hypothetical protein